MNQQNTLYENYKFVRLGKELMDQLYLMAEALELEMDELIRNGVLGYLNEEGREIMTRGKQCPICGVSIPGKKRICGICRHKVRQMNGNALYKGFRKNEADHEASNGTQLKKEIEAA